MEQVPSARLRAGAALADCLLHLQQIDKAQHWVLLGIWCFEIAGIKENVFWVLLAVW